MNHYQYNQATPGVTTVTPGVAVLRGRGNPNIKVKRTCIEILCEPCLIFLVTTLLVTALATTLLYNALTSRYWEMMIYDRDQVSNIVDNKTSLTVEWLLEDRVCKITNLSALSIEGEAGSSSSPTVATPLGSNNVMSKQSNQDGRGSSSKNINNNNNNNNQLQQLEEDSYAFSTNPEVTEIRDNYISSKSIVFLLPLHSGIWVTCIDITDPEFELLQEFGNNRMMHCVDHLNPDAPKPPEGRKWQHRMQNLAIACAMVCLILLGAAVVVGLFGILRRQISAILVTGVIYVLAALFALFTLTIVHLKHKNRHESEMLDVWTQLTPDYKEYSLARIITHGWSLHLGWAGSFVCVLASIMWILLSKIMRYNPISLFP